MAGEDVRIEVLEPLTINSRGITGGCISNLWKRAYSGKPGAPNRYVLSASVGGGERSVERMNAGLFAAAGQKTHQGRTAYACISERKSGLSPRRSDQGYNPWGSIRILLGQERTGSVSSSDVKAAG